MLWVIVNQNFWLKKAGGRKDGSGGVNVLP